MNKVYKIDVRVDEYTINKLNELAQYYSIPKTKLVEKMIDCMYDKDIMGNDFSPDTRKDCMAHICNIVTDANCIEDDTVRKNILEEVEKICPLLK